MRSPHSSSNRHRHRVQPQLSTWRQRWEGRPLFSSSRHEQRRLAPGRAAGRGGHASPPILRDHRACSMLVWVSSRACLTVRVTARATARATAAAAYCPSRRACLTWAIVPSEWVARRLATGGLRWATAGLPLAEWAAVLLAVWRTSTAPDNKDWRKKRKKRMQMRA